MKTTPLHQAHVAANARMIDFGGWDMPVRYSSEKEEHFAVRKAVGLFDVSHMGEVFIEGEAAFEAIQQLMTNDASAIVNGQAMYAGLLKEDGTFVDDCVVYRFSEQKFLVCVNASNREKDVRHIQDVVEKTCGARAQVRDESDAWAQIAVQGPLAESLVSSFTTQDLTQLGGYHFCEGSLRVEEQDVPALIARTGYTGEDGFELYVSPDNAVALWTALAQAAQPMGGIPCGLAARDTLRLEAGMCLYGNDIDETRTPLEAGLSWIVKLQKPNGFVGAEALRDQKARGVQQRLRGLVMQERGIPRHGYKVLDESGTAIGEVTSGTQAPFLGKAIAMAYVDVEHAAFGNTVSVEIRGKAVSAEVVKLPFYRRAKA